MKGAFSALCVFLVFSSQHTPTQSQEFELGENLADLFNNVQQIFGGNGQTPSSGFSVQELFQGVMQGLSTSVGGISGTSWIQSALGDWAPIVQRLMVSNNTAMDWEQIGLDAVWTALQDDRFISYTDTLAEQALTMMNATNVTRDAVLELRSIIMENLDVQITKADTMALTTQEKIMEVIHVLMEDENFVMRGQIVNSDKIEALLQEWPEFKHEAEWVAKRNETALKNIFGEYNEHMPRLVIEQFDELAANGTLNFGTLSDERKLLLIALTIDYWKLTEPWLNTTVNVVVDRLDNALNITDLLEDQLMSMSDMLMKQLNITNGFSSEFVSSVAQQINQQLVDMVATDFPFNSNSTQHPMYHVNRLRELLMQYNYTETGVALMGQVWFEADRLSRNYTTIEDFLNDFINQNGKALRERIPSFITSSFNITQIDELITSILDSVDFTAAENSSLWSQSGPLFKLGLLIESLPDQNEIGQELINIIADPSSLTSLAGSVIPESFSTTLNSITTAAETSTLFLYSKLRELFLQALPLPQMMSFVEGMIADSKLVSGAIWTVSEGIHTAFKAAKGVQGPSFNDLPFFEQALIAAQHFPRADVTEKLERHMNETRAHYMKYLQPDMNAQCAMDLQAMQGELDLEKFMDPAQNWAWKMVDAAGKLGDSFLEGGTSWLGSKPECESITGYTPVTNDDGTNTTTSWKTNYCQASIVLNGVPGPFGVDEMSINWGVCLPASCKSADLKNMMKVTQAVSLNVSKTVCWDESPINTGHMKHDSRFILACVILGAIVVIVLISTIIDRACYIIGEDSDEKPKKEADIELKYRIPDLGNNEKEGLENGGYTPDADVENHTNGDLKHMNGNGKLNGEANGYAGHEESEVKAPKQKKSVCKQLVKSFSVYNNLSFLLNTEERKGSLKGLNSIRFLSMSWVILGHVYAMPFSFNPKQIKNPMSLITSGTQGDWTFYGIVGGLFAVDSFFLLSGLLVGYLFLKMMDKVKGRIRCSQIVLYYVHRWLRLTPLYGAVILIMVGFHNYIGESALWSWDYERGGQVAFCDNNWWAALLYINNFYKPKAMCVGWGWYLANDFQFYAISPALLIPLYKWPIVGMLMIGALMCSHLGVTLFAWIEAGSSQGTMNGHPTAFNDIYIKPYTRIGPYLVGLVLAYILFRKVRVTKKWLQMAWWLFALAVICVCVYVPYDYTKDSWSLFTSPEYDAWSTTERAVYEAFSRTGWGIALAWIIFACNTNCAGFIGDFLNWKGWAPLSKLTYAAYLIHPILQVINGYNYPQPWLSTTFFQVREDIVLLVFSYLVGLVLHLLYEAPMAGIEKLLLPRH